MAEKVKVWRVTPDSSAHILMKDSAVYVAASSKNFMAIDGNGITLRGNISIASMGQGQRTGGLFVNQNEIVNMIPKTMMTPIPIKMPIPPLGFVKNVIKAVQFGLAMMVG